MVQGFCKNWTRNASALKDKAALKNEAALHDGAVVKKGAATIEQVKLR